MLKIEPKELKQPLPPCGLALMALVALMLGAGCTLWSTAPEARAAEESTETIETNAAYLEARLAMAEGKLEQARVALDRVLERGDAPAIFYKAKAELLLERGAEGADAAREVIEEGLVGYPDDIELLMMRGAAQERQGDVDGAIETLEAIAARQPANRRILEQLSQLHLRRFRFISTAEALQGEIRDLIDVYKRMLDMSRGDERLGPLLVLNSLHLRVDEPATALEFAQEARALRPNDARPMMAVAESHAALGNVEAALEAYREAFVADPSNTEAMQGLTELLVMNGEIERLERFMEDLTEKHPDRRELRLQAVKGLMEAEAWTAAERELKAMLKQWPDDAQLNMSLALTYQSMNRMDEALRAARAAVVAAPQDRELMQSLEGLLEEVESARVQDFYVRLAEMRPEDKAIQLEAATGLVREQAWPRAESLLRTVVERWPEEPRARLELVRTLLAQEELTEAARQARQLARINKELAPAVTMTVAEALISKDRAEEAIALMNDYQTLGLPNQDVAVWLAWLHMDRDRPEEAVRVLRRFQEEQPGSLTVTNILVELYIEMGDFARAHAELDALPPDVREANAGDVGWMQARIYRREGELDEALETMEALLADNGDNAQYHIEAGLLNQEMRRLAEAETHYKRAIEIEPEDPETYNTLGYFYAETSQQLDKAVDLINKALEMAPQAGHIVDSLGWVQYQRGEYEAAVQTLERAVAMMADDPDPVIYDHLGDAYEKMNRLQEARTAWEEALKHRPRNGEAIREKLRRTQHAAAVSSE